MILSCADSQSSMRMLSVEFFRSSDVWCTDNGMASSTVLAVSMGGGVRWDKGKEPVRVLSQFVFPRLILRSD